MENAALVCIEMQAVWSTNKEPGLPARHLRFLSFWKKRDVAAELPRPTNFLAPNSEPDQPSYTLSLPSWFSISAYPAWNGPEQRSIAALIRQKVSYLKPST